MDCFIELYNNYGSKYSIKSKILICKFNNDDENIKIDFQSKEHFIKFEFDTLEDDIFINMNFDKLGKLEITNKNDFRLNHTIDKYKARIAYKIKWDLNTNKKKIKVKNIIINKINHPLLFDFFEKYALVI